LIICVETDRPKKLVEYAGTAGHYGWHRFRYMGVQPVFRQIVDVAGLKPRSASLPSEAA